MLHYPKTAVIYSGQARTFAQTFPNQYWHVLRKLPNPQFFVSVADDEQADDMLRLRERFPAESIHFEKVAQPQIPEPPADPKWLAMYPPSATPQAILRQLWALQRAWEFMHEETEVADLTAYAYVRIRPDLAFARFELPTMAENTCFTPWWARWGGVNDRFAVMPYTPARGYFTTFGHIKFFLEEGCPLHPETLLAASLQYGYTPSSPTLATEFSTIRMDGKVVPPSITTIDSIEYARTRA